MQDPDYLRMRAQLPGTQQWVEEQQRIFQAWAKQYKDRGEPVPSVAPPPPAKDYNTPKPPWELNTNTAVESPTPISTIESPPPKGEKKQALTKSQKIQRIKDSIAGFEEERQEMQARKRDPDSQDIATFSWIIEDLKKRLKEVEAMAD